jgi:streptogramin lyase
VIPHGTQQIVFKLDPGARPEDLVFDERTKLLWFLDEEGVFGWFNVDDHRHQSYPKTIPYAGPVDSLTTWPPGDRVWSFATNKDSPVFVSCGTDGSYEASRDLVGIPGARSYSVAVTIDQKQVDALIAAPHGLNVLVFFSKNKETTQSDDVGFSPYGIAVSPRDRRTCWLSDRGTTRKLATYDSQTGKFEPQPELPVGFQPGRIAFDTTGDTLWIATSRESGPPVVFAYTPQKKEFTPVTVPYPANRLQAVPDGGVWFTATVHDAVVHIGAGNAQTGKRPVTAFPVGKGSSPTGLAVVGKSCWVALKEADSLVRLTYQLRVVAGENQSAQIGHRFPSPLKVRALTFDEVPQGKQPVVFGVVNDSAVFPNGKKRETVETGDDGVATSSTLTATRPGPCLVTVSWERPEHGVVGYFQDLQVVAGAAVVGDVG